MGDFSMTRAEAIRNHYRGMANNERVVYVPDEYGNVYPVVYGTDAAGNPMIISENTPWYNNLLLQGVNTVGSIWGGGGRRNFGYDPALAASVTATPSSAGVGLGISTNTLIIIGIVAAFFLLGKRGRG
jgi:hypothetical protein